MDPPITEVESLFLKTIKEDIPKLFFILNKTDTASAGETWNIVHFLESELNRLQIEVTGDLSLVCAQSPSREEPGL